MKTRAWLKSRGVCMNTRICFAGLSAVVLWVHWALSFFCPRPYPSPFIELSSQSDMVFLPFRFRSDEIITLFDRPAAELMRWMSTTVLIQAAEDIDLDAEPEFGEAGRRAEVLDELEEARQNASNAEKAAQEAAERAKAAQARITELEPSEGSEKDDELRKAEKEARNTEIEAEKAMRKAAKAGARTSSLRPCFRGRLASKVPPPRS